MTAALYLLTVAIWGTTWIALKLQLGVVPIAWSIAYRFALACAVLFAALAARGVLRLPARGARRLVLAQGLCLFSMNFLCFLEASRTLASGLVAVVFSTATLWNALGARLVFKRRLAPAVVGGGLLGLAGLGLMFSPQFAQQGAPAGIWRGLACALGGTVCFSGGNLLSTRLQALGEPPWLTNAWGMLVGAAVLAGGCVFAGVPIGFDASPGYVGALLYLAIPGSVVGFTAYLTLVGRLGPERAAYCTVLFPLVALGISSVAEGYRWTPAALLGLGLVMAGNVLAFRKPAGGRWRALAGGAVAGAERGGGGRGGVVRLARAARSVRRMARGW